MTGRGTVAFKPPEVVIFTLISQVGVSKVQRGDVTCPQPLRDHPSGLVRGAIPGGAGCFLALTSFLGQCPGPFRGGKLLAKLYLCPLSGS